MDPYQANQIYWVESVQRRAARFMIGQHKQHISVTTRMQVLQ